MYCHNIRQHRMRMHALLQWKRTSTLTGAAATIVASTKLYCTNAVHPYTCKLARKDGIKAKMAVVERARLQNLSPKHTAVLQRTHIPAVQRHLRLFNQLDLADIVWAAGRLASMCDHPTSMRDHPTSMRDHLAALQISALQAWPSAQPWGTLSHRATQLTHILKGVAAFNGADITAEMTSTLHHHTLELLPTSNDRALADMLTAWQRRPDLQPLHGVDVHAARVAVLLQQGAMGVQPLARVLSYWATHVGRVPAVVDAQTMAAVLTTQCAWLHVRDVEHVLEAWERLGGVPAGGAVLVDVLRAHDRQRWDQGEPWVDHFLLE